MMNNKIPDTVQELALGLDQAGEKAAVLAMQDDGYDYLSYEALGDRVGRLATGLAAQKGIGPGIQVALLAENRPEWILACLAVFAAGAIVVPLDVQLGDETLAHIFQDSEVRLIFASYASSERLEKLKNSLAESPEIVLFDAAEEGGLSFEELFSQDKEELPDCGPQDQAALFYTSGTTGPPKGVPLSHANLVFQLRTVQQAGLVSTDDRVLLPLPFHHVYPLVIGIMAPLALSLPIILPRSMTGPQILRAVREGRATIIIGVPRLYRAMDSGIASRAAERGKFAWLLYTLTHGLSIRLNRRLGLRAGKTLLRPLHRQFGPSLRVLASGGSALDPELAWRLEGFGWQVAIGYGLTETAPLLTINPPGSGRLESVGKPVDGVELRLDTSVHPGSAEEKPPRGEILARGPNVFSGYRNLPDKNAEIFTDDGWYRTGDLGFLGEGGFLYLQGRSSTLIITESGKNIQPDEVEERYNTHPYIREVGILHYKNRLVAVLVPDLTELRRAGETNIDQAVHRAVSEQGRKLPSYQRLEDYAISREALARTRLGKIRRHLLSRRYEEARAVQNGEKTRETGPIAVREMSDHDRALLDVSVARTVWDLLARRYPEARLTPDASPDLDLGIDSLEWLTLTMEIGQRTGVELAEEAIGRIDTVRDLLEEIAGQAEQGEANSPDWIVKHPEEIIDNRQRRWLEPLNFLQLIPARILYLLNRFLMKTLFRLKVEGLENVPRNSQFVLAPNHVSFLDPFVIVAALPFSVLRRTFFAGWTGIAFRNVFFRLVSRLAQAVPIDARRAVASSLAFGAMVLKRRHNLVWFPEGERSPGGELQEFKPGIGILLNQYKVRILPAYIQGAYEAMPRGRTLPRFKKIIVVFDSPVDVDEIGTEEEGRPQDAIRRGLYERVAALRDRTDQGRKQ